jgi:hypothetical protein
MIRNLKVLGLALVAVFAFSAMAASGAMAQEGKLTSANKNPFTLTGTEVAGNENAFTGAFGVTVRCPGSTYAGHKVKNTPHELVPNGATETTVTPTYKECKDANGDPRTVSMNGCDFVLYHATTVTPPNVYSITADIVCPVGKTITVTGGSCAIAVGSQTGLTGLTVTNEAGDVRLSGKLTLKATVCGFIGTTATQDQNVTVKAHDSEKNPVNISMSD